MRIASIALAQAAQAAPDFHPVVRPLYDPLSYLFNTDGLVFSDMGYPVILINEHISLYENFNRNGYHMSTDTIQLMDVHFASSLGKTAIATAAFLAASPTF